MEKAYFAAGCFWGTEKFFKKEFKGKLESTTVGYIGGAKVDPTYKEVCSGKTGHTEALEVVYDPKKVSFEAMCRFFFKIHDPTTKDRQQNDVGTQYRSGVFYTTDEQKQIAEKVVKETGANANFLKAFKNAPIVSEVTKAGTFFSAEDYHQDYLDVNPTGYCTHKVYWND